MECVEHDILAFDIPTVRHCAGIVLGHGERDGALCGNLFYRCYGFRIGSNEFSTIYSCHIVCFRSRGNTDGEPV